MLSTVTWGVKSKSFMEYFAQRKTAIVAGVSVLTVLLLAASSGIGVSAGVASNLREYLTVLFR